MKKILLLQFYLFFLILSCQGKMRIENEPHQVNEEEKIEIKKDTMKDLDIKSMKEMLDKEYDNIDGDIPAEETSIKWLNSEIYKSLLKNGYKTPSLEDFQLKMQTIFGINLKIKQPCKWNKKDNEYITLYGKRFIKDKKSGSYKNISRPEFYESDYSGNIFFMLDNHFMSFIISPVRIVDFPLDSTSYKVKIPQEMISRNKYLLNDDKSQFSWLIHNDENFMRSLVTTYGYTEDKKLLEWVLENTNLDFYKLKNENKLDFNEFGSLFWSKSCDGKLKLHSNTFKIYQKLYKPNDNSTIRFLLDDIKEYLQYLFDENNYRGILTEDDKIEIGANLVYFAEQYKYNSDFGNSERMMGRFRYFIIDDLKGILKKNNYYNLPKFKEWWNKALYDKDFVIECEYGGICGRDNPGPDPTDPKYKNSF